MLLKLSGVKVSIGGAENIKAGGRYVYTANHSSLFDIPILIAHVPDNIRIMYKKELEKVPVWGWALKLSPFIAVNRERSREASGVLDGVVESMRSGASVLVFPEGTRSSDGSLGPFKRGAVRIAIQSGTPVIPVTICGSFNILPARTKKIQGGNVTLTIDAPIPVDGLEGTQDEKDLTAKIREVIEHRSKLCP